MLLDGWVWYILLIVAWGTHAVMDVKSGAGAEEGGKLDLLGSCRHDCFGNPRSFCFARCPLLLRQHPGVRNSCFSGSFLRVMDAEVFVLWFSR